MSVPVGLLAKYDNGIDGEDSMGPESGMGGASGTPSKNEFFLLDCNFKPWSVDTSCKKWAQMSG